jgi:hypothetical protein
LCSLRYEQGLQDQARAQEKIINNKASCPILNEDGVKGCLSEGNSKKQMVGEFDDEKPKGQQTMLAMQVFF